MRYYKQWKDVIKTPIIQVVLISILLVWPLASVKNKASAVVLLHRLSMCVFHPLVSAAVGLESLAAQRVAAARPVPGSWMVRRPDKEASLML